MSTHATEHMERSEFRQRQPVPSFCHLVPGDGTQVVRLGSKHPFPRGGSLPLALFYETRYHVSEAALKLPTLSSMIGNFWCHCRCLSGVGTPGLTHGTHQYQQFQLLGLKPTPPAWFTNTLPTERQPQPQDPVFTNIKVCWEPQGHLRRWQPFLG